MLPVSLGCCSCPSFGSLRSFLKLAWVIAISSALFGMSAVAQDRPSTDDLLPETTVVFVQIDNWRDFAEKFRQASLGRLLDDERIAPIFGNIRDEVQDTYFSKDLEENLSVGLEGLINLPQGEITFAIVAPRRKSPEYIVIVQTDPESETPDQILTRFRQGLVEERGGGASVAENDDGFEIETFSNSNGDKFKYFRKDGLFVGSTSEEELDHLIDRWMGRTVEKIRPLSQNRKFITILNRCRGSKDLKPEARFFFDPIEYTKSSTRGDVGSQFLLTLLPVLGLDGLLGVGGSILLSEDEFQSLVHAHVLLAEPRKGVFQAFALRPTDYRPEPWMPADTVSYLTTSWDFQQMLAELTKMIEFFQPEGTVDKFFEEGLDNESGLDFREEVIANFTGRVTWAKIDPKIRRDGSNLIFAFEVNDHAKMEFTLKAMFEGMNKRMRERAGVEMEDYWREFSHKDHLIVSILMESEESRKMSREYHNQWRREQGMRVYETEFELDPFAPSFAVVDNYLVYSSRSRRAVERMIDTLQGDAESLRQNDDFKRLADKMTRSLKSDMPSAVFYTNPRPLFRWIFDTLRNENNQAAIAERADEVEFLRRIKNVYDKHPLPDFSEIEHYFQPQGGFMTSDDTGLHFMFFEVRP